MSDSRFWMQLRASTIVERPRWGTPQVVLDNADIPNEYRDVQLKRIPPNLSHFAALQEVVRQMHVDLPAGKGVILHGDTSTGKTGATVALLKAAIRRGAQTFFFDCGNLPDMA